MAGTDPLQAPYLSMQRPTRILVLLVEDEPLVRMIASESLEDAGYEVLEAANAAEALDAIRARSDVGVLFTDVNMPGSLDGLALAELVHAKWPDIRLVVTSGRALPRKVPDTGAFLTKPYTVSEMARAIDRASAQP